jgi:uncharacterized protein (TIGR03084 family)
MATLSDLLMDLDAEFGELMAVVGGLDDSAPEWDLPTPAEGWAVRDQISHLAFFDDAGRLAMTDPAAFAEMVERLVAVSGDPMEVHLAKGRSMGGDGLLDWWGTAHRAMVGEFAGADPSARVPWFGPPMGVLSFISSRLMETWAHGQDVCDALGVDRLPTDRLHHVAHLGVRARPFSYIVRGRDVPEGRIDVVLTGPEGDEWRWEIGNAGNGAGDGVGASHKGDSDQGEAVAEVSGSALDFCLVVAQRRNLADTGLEMTGPLAEEWMSIAQAFAGPPGPGRPAVSA